MSRRPPRSTRTATLVPHPTLFRSRPPFRSAEVRVNRDPAVAGMAQGVEQRDGGMGRGGGILTARKIEGEPGTPPDSRQHRIVDSGRSEEHTSELQSLMRISYAVFCLKKHK